MTLSDAIDRSWGRRYRFSAAHCLASPALSEAENARIFGKCNRAGGHGHNYEFSVSLRGGPGLPPDPFAWLDALVARQVLADFAARRLDQDLPDFRERPATAENIARAIFLRLEAVLPPGLLRRVDVGETPKNFFSYPNPAGADSEHDPQYREFDPSPS